MLFDVGTQVGTQVQICHKHVFGRFKKLLMQFPPFFQRIINGKIQKIINAISSIFSKNY